MAKKKINEPGAVVVGPADTENEPITPHVEVMTVEQYKESYVAKFDANKANIKKLADKAKKLVINGIDDKDGLEKAKGIRKEVMSALSATESRRVALKEEHLRRGQAVDGYAKELSGPLRDVQAVINEKIKAIEDAKDAEKKRKETEAKAALDARVAELKEAGIVFDGEYYSIGDTIALDLATIGKFTDKQYSGVLEAVKAKKEEMDAEAERLEAERLEQQRVLKEQQEEIARKQAEQDAKEKEMQERMAELERKEREQKAREKAGRERQLAAFSLSFVPLDAVYKHATLSGSIIVTLKDVEELNDALWDDKMGWLEHEAAEIKTKEDARIKQADELKKRTIARRDKLILLAFTAPSSQYMEFVEPVTGKGVVVKVFDLENLSDEAWADRLKTIDEAVKQYKVEAKAIEDKKAADAEERRKSGLSDFQKVEEYLENFKVDKPVLLLPENQALIDAFSSNVAKGMEALLAKIIK